MGKKKRKSVRVDVMPFGKHQGQRIKELPSNYLCWFMENVDSRRCKDVYHAICSEVMSRAQKRHHGAGKVRKEPNYEPKKSKGKEYPQVLERDSQGRPLRILYGPACVQYDGPIINDGTVPFKTIDECKDILGRWIMTGTT